MGFEVGAVEAILVRLRDDPEALEMVATFVLLFAARARFARGTIEMEPLERPGAKSDLTS